METLELNLLGLTCPEPMMMLRRTVRKMDKGQKIEVETDDPSTLRDFPKFCTFQDHILESVEEGEINKFTIVKG